MGLAAGGAGVTLVLRVLLGAGGLAATVYGLSMLDDRGPDDLRAAVTWLVAGVLLHDAVLAPLTIVVCAVGAAVIPTRLRAPVTGAFLVLGSVTLVAVPVLGRFGARSDNPTLLDRHYVAGWLAMAALTLVTVLALARRRRRGAEE
jgi:hypothetical protein